MQKEKQKRNWSGYNMAQTVEAVLFVKLVARFVDALDEQELWKGIGRPPCPIKDVIKCLLVLEYFNLSSRRAVSMLQLLKGELMIAEVSMTKSKGNGTGDASQFVKHANSRALALPQSGGSSTLLCTFPPSTSFFIRACSRGWLAFP